MPRDAPETETLTAFLDHYRAVIIDKASGLSDQHLHQTFGPSTLTLGSLVHHLALAEHHWFYEVFTGGPPLEPWAGRKRGEDWELTIAKGLDTEVIFDRYVQSCAQSREIVAQAESLDVLAALERGNHPCSLRWIFVHMIEETARHTGHADLIRESIDGQVGDFRER